MFSEVDFRLDKKESIPGIGKVSALSSEVSVVSMAVVRFKCRLFAAGARGECSVVKATPAEVDSEAATVVAEQMDITITISAQEIRTALDMATITDT